MDQRMSSPVIEAREANLYLLSGKTQLHILKGIDLTVDASEVTAVVGPSGSGKTSLLMVLAGLERATSGTVTVAGENLSRLDEDELAIFRRGNVGILFQNFHLIPSLTALENVSLALELAETGQSLKQMRRDSEAALEEVGLKDRMNHLPTAMSGGEQQRVGLARAMVARPRILLADEPTGNLDQDTGQRVIELMFDVARERQTAMMLITHDPALAKRADRRMVMDHGVLSEQVETVSA